LLDPYLIKRKQLLGCTEAPYLCDKHNEIHRVFVTIDPTPSDGSTTSTAAERSQSILSVLLSELCNTFLMIYACNAIYLSGNTFTSIVFWPRHSFPISAFYCLQIGSIRLWLRRQLESCFRILYRAGDDRFGKNHGCNVLFGNEIAIQGSS